MASTFVALHLRVRAHATWRALQIVPSAVIVIAYPFDEDMRNLEKVCLFNNCSNSTPVAWTRQELQLNSSNMYPEDRGRPSLILTIDHDDFETYRIHGRRRFRIVPGRTPEFKR